MSEKEKMLQAISLSLTAGYQIDEEALDFLHEVSQTEDPIEFVENVLAKLKVSSDKPISISRLLFEEMWNNDLLANRTKALDPELMAKPNERLHVEFEPKINSSGSRFRPIASTISKDIEVLEDPTNSISSAGSINEYLDYFQDRFKRIDKLIRQRMDSKSAVSIRTAFRVEARSKLMIVCIVTERREVKSGLLLTVEDLEASATVFIPSNAAPNLKAKVKSLLPDQIVCLSLLKSRRNMFIVQDLIFPDLPIRKPSRASEPVCAALISDLHVGSKEFLDVEFSHFLQWLNGKRGPKRSREIASLVKYVIVAGDIVDGVGIYPKQIEELEIEDIYSQYELAAKFLSQIPEYIEIIIIPGNHDATRKALPQPAIPKDYAEPLYESREVLSLGNPATVRVHGVEFLLYHGRSLDDVLATAVDMDFHSPEKAMRVLLKCRHLAPTYGQRTQIAPEKKDFLVINRPPDVFHAGHVHVLKYENYKGTLLVNSGAWQSQTRYQRELGLKPTPGVIPVVNLQTLSVVPLNFNVS